jgi:hypothetical protein
MATPLAGPDLPREGGVTPNPDWASQTTESIVRVVGQVRDRTTLPLLTASRGIVFGLLAAIVGVAALVLFLVLTLRVLDIVLPRGVWLAYLVLGIVFVIAGAVLMRLRRSSLEAS